MRYLKTALVGLMLSVLCSAPMVIAGGPDQAAFPEGFLWGSFISAHSTEGNHLNDWTTWESIPGRIVDGSVSGAACNSWELFGEDHQWMKKLGHNVALFSLEWSKLEPARGAYDEAAFAHYRQVLESLKSNGIKPIVVLWDRTLPQWEASQGGFENPRIIFDFGQYAARVGKSLGDLVDCYVTLNDPIGFANRAFKDGIFPPGKSDLAALAKAQLMMLGMHNAARNLLLENDKTAACCSAPCQVGLLVGMKWTRPARIDNPLDVSLARAADGFSGRTFIETLMQGQTKLPAAPPPPPMGKFVKGVPEAPPMPPAPPTPPNYDARTIDFLIVDYKGLEEIRFNVFKPLFIEKTVPAGLSLDDAGQVIFPEGLTQTMMTMKKYPVPVYVMSGIADKAGANRGKFLSEHVKQLGLAMAQGCNIRGFLYKTLLSGFEYEKGFSLKAGLLTVNTQIQERKAAGGADVFKALAASNGVSDTPRKARKPRKPVSPK